MKSTLDTPTNNGLLALFKGESGEGKSTAALSFPAPFVFDFDKKMPGIANKHFPGKEVHWDTFNDIFEVENKLAEFREFCPYETLIADSFTSLCNLCITTVGSVKGENVPDLLKRVQETRAKTKQIEMMGIDYYSAEDRFATYFIEQLKLLFSKEGNPKHVIVTAHVITTESAPDLKTRIVTRNRSIVAKGRKVAAWLPTEFDNLYVFGREQEFGSDEIRRLCVTESFNEDSAKCTLPIPKRIEFTNTSLYDQLFREPTL